MKIGFIGTGNMASAIIKGIIEKEFIKAKNIYLFDVMTDKVTEFSKEIGANVCRSNDELIRSVDVVVLSVKPNIIEKILNETRELIIEKRPLLISIAAGTPIEKLSTFLRRTTKRKLLRSCL